MGAQGSRVSTGLLLILSVQTWIPEENWASSRAPSTLRTPAHGAPCGAGGVQLNFEADASALRASGGLPCMAQPFLHPRARLGAGCTEMKKVSWSWSRSHLRHLRWPRARVPTLPEENFLDDIYPSSKF